MPRQSRQTSGTGIYHVMLRGINQQNIFEVPEDYWKFIRLLDQTIHPKDEFGHLLPPRCTIYAYCLMSNHVHLLIREGQEGIAAIIRSIGIAYAIHFNHSYQHKGHLFQDRYKSEPVNDMAYFITLLRYIHQNPVAAGIVNHVSDYTWSSWIEYEGKTICSMPVCTIQHVLNRIPRDELLALINDPLPKSLRILDFDCNASVRLSDDEVRSFSQSIGICSLQDIQHFPKDQRDNVLRQLKDYGASIRQLVRLTGISFGIIRGV